ncbi:uncharacterized protein BP01DRAFT_414697 [Aspergillus saccharolyticus JOP 1030-1]|uniref:Aminoglycoside phosphotransferase domain-containing protein n=1 Tax=Aspergillus saccharolyticus JOP 1030-1 TaxID=1450539 RepID=A0A318ZGQ6_9EURO|nr:hypothetical protein BP01DRAFT_414697 [Aspergillus saccharolyticus JOP 1030-1]PYH46736.1 hypothetical protein BP01DRAFT_414697 [Aspergillus saccharolyticus JOP 1030-1]
MAHICKTKAAKFNAHTLTKLQAAIEKDPEIDLTAKLPLRYSDRLKEMRQNETATSIQDHGEDDIRASIFSSDSAEMVFPLSDTVQDLLGTSGSAAEQSHYLAQQIIEIIGSSKVIWKGPFARRKMVLSCGHNIILKAVRDLDDTTEYTTLLYLHQHKPNIAAPKPLGSLPYETGTPFGGPSGEGCKDIRRHLRRSLEPILTVDEFEDFLFTSNRAGGESPSPAIVFTHGDLRPENIVVDLKGNEWTITGLIDWEYSGFYPEYYEAIRCTNCMAPYEENDWYLFRPDCVSPKRYTHWWLLDRAREVRVV